MKKIIILFLFLFLFSGCSRDVSNKEMVKKYQNRDISRQEAESFVPINYNLVNKNDWSDNIVIEKLVINDKYFYILPLLPEVNPLESSDTIKLLLLKYDNEKNQYLSVDEYSGTGNEKFKIISSHDVNRDSVNELFISFDENWGGSGAIHYMKVLKITSSGIEEIFSIDDTITSLYLNEEPKRVMGASFIWGEGESHFGCHYWNINEYHYDDSDGFYLYNTKKTDVKYDMGDEYQIDYKNCFPFPTDLNEFFEKERINR